MFYNILCCVYAVMMNVIHLYSHLQGVDYMPYVIIICCHLESPRAFIPLSIITYETIFRLEFIIETIPMLKNTYMLYIHIHTL